MIHRTFREVPTHGDPIHGDVRIPDGPPPEGVVVVAHGFKGFKDWGFFPYLCESLAGAGLAAVSFNFSLNGVGSGDPTEFNDLEGFGRNTLSRELEDLHFVVDAVREGDLLPRPPRRLGLLGHSRGGASVILVARELAAAGWEPDALVTWSSVSTLDRWPDPTKEEWREEGRLYVLNARTGQQMPLDVSLLEDFEENRERLDVERAAEEVEAPWLILHGADDASVPVAEARRLASAAGENARLSVVEGAGHTFEVGHPFQEPSPEFAQALNETASHFRRHLIEEG